MYKDETTETPRPSPQAKPHQGMTKLTPRKQRNHLIGQPPPLPASPPLMKRKSPTQSAVNPGRPQLCPPELVSAMEAAEPAVVRTSKQSFEMDEVIPGSRSGTPCALEPVSSTLTTAPRILKRRLGMGSATAGYSNKKFKVPDVISAAL